MEKACVLHRDIYQAFVPSPVILCYLKLKPSTSLPATQVAHLTWHPPFYHNLIHPDMSPMEKQTKEQRKTSL